MSAIAVAVATVGGAAIGAFGSMSAADTQASAQQQASQTQQNMFNTINAQNQPFIQGGYSALNALLYGTGTGGTPIPGISSGQLTKGFSPTDFVNNLDPGYQFALETGGQAIRNADTPGVGALSGPALKDLMSFNQGMARTGYMDAFNRFQTQNNNIFSRLSGIAGLGQNAATNVGTSGTQLGTGMAQAQAAAGGSRAGGIVGATNALSGSAVPLAYLMAANSGGGGGGGGMMGLNPTVDIYGNR